MNELHAILHAWRGLEGPNRDAVLATVVHVRGSAYRRPGARMLIVPDGRRVGSISGGCLEGEITRKAWWFTESGTPVVRVYDTTSDDDAVWEFGLGCNGVVQVMLERVDTPDAGRMLAFLDDHRAGATPAVIATVIHPAVGDRWLCGKCFSLPADLPPALAPHIESAFQERRSGLVHLGDTQIFVEWVGPPPSLAILGAGHDAIPLVAIASEFGWRITVADGRPTYAQPARFPGAERVLTMPSHDPLRDVAIDSDTAVVMMTHNYPLDARLLPRILAMRPRYLGLLGPRQRAERLFAELGIDPPSSVHAPIGLDIGGDNPAAIAASIVAEIQAALSDRAGGMLKHRAEPIHAPAPEFGMPSPAAVVDAARPEYCETNV